MSSSATIAKATSPQFTRDAVRKCGKSEGYYPKPVDLLVVRVKRSESCVEAQSDAVSKRSCES